VSSKTQYIINQQQINKENRKIILLQFTDLFYQNIWQIKRWWWGTLRHRQAFSNSIKKKTGKQNTYSNRQSLNLFPNSMHTNWQDGKYNNSMCSSHLLQVDGN